MEAIQVLSISFGATGFRDRCRKASANKHHIEPTTVLADRKGIKYNGQDRFHYVFGSHWLARFWISAECIIWKVSFPEFQDACITSGVVDSI